MNLSVVGLGKLGAPMLAVLAAKGHQVVGYDINTTFVSALDQGVAPVDETDLQSYLDAHRQNYTVTSDLKVAISQTDVTFVIVPTPSQENGFFSNDYLSKALHDIGEALKEKSTYHLIVVTSTVMPGSMDTVLQPILEASSGKKVGPNMGLCYSPEFIALGSVIKNMLYPDFFLVGESDEKAGDLLQDIYKKSCNNDAAVKRMNFVNAELTKISVNTYVTSKISYANMLSDMCDHFASADVDVVTDAVGEDMRIGKRYLKGGVAYGGPCFPRDNRAFMMLADTIGVRADLASATDEINQHQSVRILKYLDCYEMNTSHKIGILGLSYKAGTPVIEQSQGVDVAKTLVSRGFDVTVYDPQALENARKMLGESVHYAASTQELVDAVDFVVVATNWPEFSIIESMEIQHHTNHPKYVLDCWRQLKNVQDNGLHILWLGAGNLLFSDAHKQAA